MRLFDGTKMNGGWFIGDFEPSAYKTEDFEVCYKQHYRGEKWDTHYHSKTIEINYVIEGIIKINDYTMGPHQIFILDKEEVAKPEFLTDVKLIVVKIPSIPGDKHIVKEN